MNAALGTRLVPDFFFAGFLAEDFFAVRFFPPEDFFFAELFFFVAIASPGN
jgi:hypothetical protein